MRKSAFVLVCIKHKPSRKKGLQRDLKRENTVLLLSESRAAIPRLKAFSNISSYLSSIDSYSPHHLHRRHHRPRVLVAVVLREDLSTAIPVSL